MIRIPEYLERRAPRSSRERPRWPAGDRSSARRGRLRGGDPGPGRAARRRGRRRRRRSTSWPASTHDEAAAWWRGRIAGVADGTITRVRRARRRRPHRRLDAAHPVAQPELAASRRDRQGPRPSIGPAARDRAGPDGGRRDDAPGPRAAGCSSSTRRPAATPRRCIGDSAGRSSASMPNHALLPGRHAVRDDVLLEGPPVSDAGRRRPRRSSSRPTRSRARSPRSRSRARSPTAGAAPARTTRSSSRPLADGGEGTLEASRPPAAGPGRRPTVARPARPADRGALAALRTTATRAVVEMAEASGLSRLGRRRARPDRGHDASAPGELIRAALDAGVRRIIARASAAAPRPTAAAGCSSARRADRDARRRPRRLDAARELDCGRLRRHEPAPRPDRARPRSTGRRRARRRTQVADARRAGSPRWADALEARDRPPRARHARGRRGRRRRLRAAGDPGPVPVVRAAPRRRPRHGGDRLRRQARPAPTSSSPARAGSTPRPRSARPPSASPGGRRRRASRASRSAAASSPRASRRSPPSARSPSPSSSARSPSRRRWPPAPRPLERCGERLAAAASSLGRRLADR